MFDLNFKDFSKESTAKKGGGVRGGVESCRDRKQKSASTDMTNSGLILENSHKVNKIKQKMLVQDPLWTKCKPFFNSVCSRRVPWCNGVMVSTLHFESSDPSSNLGGTLYNFNALLLLLPEGVRWNKITMLRQLNSQQRLPKVQSVQSTFQPVWTFFIHFVSDSRVERVPHHSCQSRDVKWLVCF